MSAGLEIDRAVDLLRAGRLVAFPTETVYGLGADATNPQAVRRIFAAKARPPTNPLIVHVADVATACRYVTNWPEPAEQLAAAFWPGPLTLVLPKSPQIVSDVSAGRDTIGVRVPNHPLALQLLRAFAGPVAAPSANRSNHISPTTAAHVREELGDTVDLILDGGPCVVGIESTVLDLTGHTPALLRPGGVSAEQIEAVVGPIHTAPGVVAPGVAAASPGQHAQHYAPRSPAFRFAANAARPQKPGAVYLLLNSLPPTDYANRLYGALRDLDAQHPTAIFVEMPPDEPAWFAVRDRLRRATRPLNERT